MPKEGIHPNYSDFILETFANAEGDKMTIKSKIVDGNGRTIASETNHHNHPAWKTDNSNNIQENVGNITVNKFNAAVSKFIKKNKD